MRQSMPSRQYQQRVDCKRLPPIVPMFRSCGEAASRAASRSASGIAAESSSSASVVPRADAGAVDPARQQVTHVDERVGLEQPVAQLRHDLGPARDERAGVGQRVEALRPNELERRSDTALMRPPSARSPRAFRRASESAFSISSREIGSERISAPVASRIAFAIAAATGTIGGSPRPFAPRFVSCASGTSTNSVTISGTSAIVGRRYASSVRVRIVPVRGSESRSSESVWPMPWITPPSTWLRAPSGLMTRPMSWIAAMRSTVTSPVSTSTATSATWMPNVSTS